MENLDGFFALNCDYSRLFFEPLSSIVFSILKNIIISNTYNYPYSAGQEMTPNVEDGIILNALDKN